MKHFSIALIVVALALAVLSFFIPKGFFGTRQRDASSPVVRTIETGDNYKSNVESVMTKLSTDIKALTRKNYNAHYKVLELKDIATAAIGDLRKLRPPSDVSEIHYATISALQFCVDAINDRGDFMDDVEATVVMSRCAAKINSIGD